jgi:hypothetical protein
VPNPIPPYPLLGWEIEALPDGLVHCRLKIAHSIEHAERGDFRLVPLGIPAAECQDLARALQQKAAQALQRKRPATQ